MPLIPVADLERAAWHESGHAVVGVVLRLPIVEASIGPMKKDDGSGGRVWLDVRPEARARQKKTTARRWYERELVFILAGPVAEAVRAGVPYRCKLPSSERREISRDYVKKSIEKYAATIGAKAAAQSALETSRLTWRLLRKIHKNEATTDEEHAERLARTLISKRLRCSGGPQTVREWVDYATGRAEKILGANWPAVKRVRDAFYQYPNLHEKHLIKLVGKGGG